MIDNISNSNYESKGKAKRRKILRTFNDYMAFGKDMVIKSKRKQMSYRSKQCKIEMTKCSSYFFTQKHINLALKTDLTVEEKKNFTDFVHCFQMLSENDKALLTVNNDSENKIDMAQCIIDYPELKKDFTHIGNSTYYRHVSNAKKRLMTMLSRFTNE